MSKDHGKLRISSTPGVDRAFSFLQSVVDQARIGGHNHLPTVRVMARRAGVSLVTMWKAVQRLKETGCLYSAQRGGLILAGNETDVSQADLRGCMPRSVWMTTVSRMEHDILNRVFAPGEMLPSAKQLQSRYGVAYLTLRKALDDLCARGVIVPRHRGFALSYLQSRRPLSRVVLLSARRFSREIEGNELSVGILGQEGIRQIEIECSRAGVLLDTYYYSQDGDRVLFCRIGGGRPAELTDADDVLGYLWLITGTEVPLNIDVRQIISRLAGFDKPVSVLSEIAEATPSLNQKFRPRIRLFTVALDREPAAMVGRFLLDLGHRRIAYLSPFHRFSWSRARYAGLDATFASAGLGQAVELFALEHRDDDDYYACAVDAGKLASLRTSIDRWRKSVPEEIVRQTAGYFDYAMRVGLEMGQIDHLLHPLFSRALSDASITAWVTANDGVACMALGFLTRQGIRIPQDLSVISFDDSLMATANQLTSYDFNLSAYVSAMLGHVLKCAWYPETMAIQGWIVQRSTTGPAGR